MNYNEVLANARENIGKLCKACPVCNGLACRNTVPGPGAKGVGDTAIRNYFIMIHNLLLTPTSSFLLPPDHVGLCFKYNRSA